MASIKEGGKGEEGDNMQVHQPHPAAGLSQLVHPESQLSVPEEEDCLTGKEGIDIAVINIKLYSAE